MDVGPVYEGCSLYGHPLMTPVITGGALTIDVYYEYEVCYL